MDTVEVVTRYGAMHLAKRPVWFSSYAQKDRHFTLCMGTSSWTIEGWEGVPHPLLSHDEIVALEMNCEACKRIRGL